MYKTIVGIIVRLLVKASVKEMAFVQILDKRTLSFLCLRFLIIIDAGDKFLFLDVEIMLNQFSICK